MKKVALKFVQYDDYTEFMERVEEPTRENRRRNKAFYSLPANAVEITATDTVKILGKEYELSHYPGTFADGDGIPAVHLDPDSPLLAMLRAQVSGT